jgi:hypothetical protein
MGLTVVMVTHDLDTIFRKLVRAFCHSLAQKSSSTTCRKGGGVRYPLFDFFSWQTERAMTLLYRLMI